MAGTFAETAIKFIGDGSALKPNLAGIEKAVSDSASRMASTVKTAALAISGAVVAGAGTLAVLVKLSANAGDELAKMSQRVATSVETLSGYKLAADLAGISLEDLGSALQKGSKNLVDAAHGTGTAADAYDALGIRVTESGGKLKSIDQVMLEVADKFAGMEDGAQKTAFAIDLFGKSGAGLIPLLNQGSAAIAAQRKEAVELGAGWTTTQAKLAEDFNDNLTRIETGLTGFRNAVVSGLLPFFNDAVSGIVEKIKEWSASGDLQQWAKATSDLIINAIVAVAEFIDAHLVEAVEGGTKAFVAMEIAARGLANGVLVITNGVLALVWAVNAGGLGIRKLLGVQESLGVSTEDVEKRVDRLSAAMAENSQQIVEMSQSINDAMGRFQTPLSEEARGRLSKLAEGVSEVALKIQGWAEKAKTGGTEAVKAIGEGVAKTGQVIVRSAKEQVKKLDEAFQALKLRGEVSLQDTLDWMQKRAALFRAGTPERNQAEAEAFNFARELADRLFAHQDALGLKSLQDAIDREKQKAATAVAGSEAQMKAQENVVKKEEELRNKRQSAALGILGEVQQRLEAKGMDTSYVTRDDVQREITAMQQERAGQTAKAQRFAAGGGGNLADVIEGYKAAGQLNATQAQQRELGGVPDILTGGAQVGKGPLTADMGAFGDLVMKPLVVGYQAAMNGAYTVVDEGVSKIEERILKGVEFVNQNLPAVIEDFLVRKLMDQAARG